MNTTQRIEAAALALINAVRADHNMPPIKSIPNGDYDQWINRAKLALNAAYPTVVSQKID